MITLFLVPLRGVQAMRRPRRLRELSFCFGTVSQSHRPYGSLQIRWYNVHYDIIQIDRRKYNLASLIARPPATGREYRQRVCFRVEHIFYKRPRSGFIYPRIWFTLTVQRHHSVIGKEKIKVFQCLSLSILCYHCPCVQNSQYAPRRTSPSCRLFCCSCCRRPKLLRILQN